MKYHKIPFKERQRHYDYQFNQTERQIKLLTERAQKQAEKEKLEWLGKCEMNDKERQEAEMFKRLIEIMERERG